MRLFVVLLPLLLAAGTAWCDQLNLRPPGSAVELRTYGFGLLPFDGKFTRFSGIMRYDPANMSMCEVRLRIEAASLAMANESIRDQILEPEMMDVVRFPDLAFRGACHGKDVIGELAMHGETHPVTFEYSRSDGTVVATAQLRRAEWGITGKPLVGGSTIRIRVVLPDPFRAPHN